MTAISETLRDSAFFCFSELVHLVDRALFAYIEGLNSRANRKPPIAGFPLSTNQTRLCTRQAEEAKRKKKEEEEKKKREKEEAEEKAD